MKFLLLLIVGLAAWWLIRGTLRSSLGPKAPPPVDPGRPETIVACRFCGVHLPVAEALPGRDGVFCDAAHRAAYEAAQPGP